jgi:ATP-dependent Clp protease ATP-binding subunit ClpA
MNYIEQITSTLRRWNKTVTIDPDALEKLVAEGYSLAFGARFLKRIIDDRIKLPLSQHWKDANAFRVALKNDEITVEAVGPRLVASADPNAIAV